MKKLVFLSAILALAACSTDPYSAPEVGSNPGPGPNEPEPCDPTVIYFEQQILPLIQSNCAKSGCHDAATAEDGVILTNYANIIATGEVTPGNPGNSELYEAITDSDPADRMPPAPETPLTTDQIQLIANWITQGAQNNSCSSGCDTTNVTWSGAIQPLVGQFCKGCHQGSTAQGGVLLENYAQVSALALNGTLLGVVRSEAGFTPMPYNSNPLEACKIRQLEIWIENGALEN